MAQKRYFQWIAGEFIGEISTLESIEEFEGETFYNFDDGEACNLRFISKMTGSASDLKGKIMVEIENPSNPWTIETIKPRTYTDESMKGEVVEIPTLHDRIQADGTNTANISNSDVGSERLVPPKRPQRFKELPAATEYAVKKKDVVQPTIKKVEQTKEDTEKSISQVVPQTSEQKKSSAKNVSNDPVRILVNSCKKHDTQVEMTLNMKLPSKYIYNIAVCEFEDGLEKFLDCIVSDIDTSMVIEQLKRALELAYSEDQDTEN